MVSKKTKMKKPKSKVVGETPVEEGNSRGYVAQPGHLPHKDRCQVWDRSIITYNISIGRGRRGEPNAYFGL